MPVGCSRDGTLRNAVGIDHSRAFEALIAPIDGAAPRDVAPTRRLGDAAVNGKLVQFQTNHAVIRREDEPFQLVHHANGDLSVPPPAKRGGRDHRIGDPVVRTVEDEDLAEFVEDDAIGVRGR